MLHAFILAAIAGNAWHIPGGAEPGIATMRDPVRAAAGAAITVYSGNQFQGAGNPGNQTQAGSAVEWRAVGASAWSETPLLYSSTSGNNKYYAATLPAQSGEIEYYL